MCSFAWLPPSFDASARDDVFRTPGRGGSTHTHNPSFRPPADVSDPRGTPQTEEGKFLGGDRRRFKPRRFDELGLRLFSMDRRGSEWFDRSVVANRGPARGAAAEWSTAPGRAAPFVELAGMLRRTDARLDFLTCFGDFSRWINRRSRSSSVSRPIGRTQARGLPSAGRAGAAAHGRASGP